MSAEMKLKSAVVQCSAVCVGSHSIALDIRLCTVYTLKSGPSPNVSPKVAGLTQAKMMIRDHILCRKYIPKSLHNLAQPFYILDYIQLCTAADDCTGCVQRPVQWRRDRERERQQIHACAVDTHHIMKGKVDLCFDII